MITTLPSGETLAHEDISSLAKLHISILIHILNIVLIMHNVRNMENGISQRREPMFCV